MDPLSMRQLEVLVALVDHGSFTAAARALGLGQSTVSGHVADLERRLSLRLVERSRSGVATTAAGEAILPSARAAVRAELDARQVAAELCGLITGSLTVGGSTIPAVYLLPDLLARFHAEHPQIQLRVRTGDSQEILDAVQAGDVEVGIVGVAPPGHALHCVPVDQDELVLICRPDHAFAGAASVTVAQLAEEPMVLRESGSGSGEAARRALRTAGLGDPHVVCEVGSTEAVKAAVRSGLGVAFVSSLAVRDEAASGVLCSCSVEGLSVARSFHVVSREPGRLGPSARRFLALIEPAADG